LLLQKEMGILNSGVGQMVHRTLAPIGCISGLNISYFFVSHWSIS